MTGEVIRPEFWALPVPQWTDAEAYQHLETTFNQAALGWPDVMEPYVVMLADTEDRKSRTSIMRRGLRETVVERYGRKA